MDDTDEVSSTGISSYVMLSLTHLDVGKSNTGDFPLGNPDVGESWFGHSKLVTGIHDGGMANMVPEVEGTTSKDDFR